MTNLISVVVPVYNVEEFLEKCVDSIIKQTYKNIEILLIDDGSTDMSGKLCDVLKEKDKRIRVFHKVNGGLSDARNYGINKASGKFITFIDSDDVVSIDFIDYLYGLIKDHPMCIGVSDLLHCFPNKESSFVEENKRRVLSSEEAIAEMLYQKSFLVAACGKIFPSSLFENIIFPKGMLFEDVAIMYKLFESVEKIIYGNAKKYGYMHRDKSITTQKFSRRELDIIKISNDILEHYSNNIKLKKAALAYSINSNLRIFLNVPKNNPDFEEIETNSKKMIEANAIRCLTDFRIRRKLRISLVLFCINKKLLFFIHKRIDRWK